MPLAPARFSTITGCPRRVVRPAASTLATRSVTPPAGTGTTNLIGLSGKLACAPAASGTIAARNANAPSNLRIVMATPSFRLDAGVLHDPAPAGDVALHQRGELAAGQALDVDAFLVERSRDLGILR